MMDKMKYRYLDHTADAKFEAYGSNLEEAFENAAQAMFNIITDTSKVRSVYKKKIHAESKRIDAMLYDFLEELLFLLDTEGFLLSGFENIRIKDGVLTAVATEDSYKVYDVKGNVKSITYNDMDISEKDGRWTITAVVDM